MEKKSKIEIIFQQTFMAFYVYCYNKTLSSSSVIIARMLLQHLNFGKDEGKNDEKDTLYKTDYSLNLWQEF